jgi:hypothetical protein
MTSDKPFRRGPVFPREGNNPQDSSLLSDFSLLTSVFSTMPHSHEINLLARYGYFAQAEIERVLLGPRAEFSLTLRPMLLSGQGKSLVLRVGGVSPFPEVEATLNDWIGYTLEGVHPQEGAGRRPAAHDDPYGGRNGDFLQKPGRDRPL